MVNIPPTSDAQRTEVATTLPLPPNTMLLEDENVHRGASRTAQEQLRFWQKKIVGIKNKSPMVENDAVRVAKVVHGKVGEVAQEAKHHHTPPTRRAWRIWSCVKLCLNKGSIPRRGEGFGGRREATVPQSRQQIHRW